MNLVKVNSISELNSLVKESKATKNKIQLLIKSEWDTPSENLVANVDSSDTDKDIYLVDIFDVPMATAMFSATKLPSLVTVKGSKIRVEDYLPRIYRTLKIS